MQKALKREVAYDLSRFDNRHIVREQVARENAKGKQQSRAKTQAKTKSCVSGFAVLSWILCMGLLTMIIYSYVALTETADQVSKLKNELSDMQEETQMLEIQKSQKYGSSQMQQIAVEQFGMQKTQKSQVTYVNTQQTDRTEVMEQTNMFSGESKLIAGIANGFRTFVEYIN